MEQLRRLDESVTSNLNSGRRNRIAAARYRNVLHYGLDRYVRFRDSYRRGWDSSDIRCLSALFGNHQKTQREAFHRNSETHRRTDEITR